MLKNNELSKSFSAIEMNKAYRTTRGRVKLQKPKECENSSDTLLNEQEGPKFQKTDVQACSVQDEVRSCDTERSVFPLNTVPPEHSSKNTTVSIQNTVLPEHCSKNTTVSKESTAQIEHCSGGTVIQENSVPLEQCPDRTVFNEDSDQAEQCPKRAHKKKRKEASYKNYKRGRKEADLKRRDSLSPSGNYFAMPNGLEPHLFSWKYDFTVYYALYQMAYGRLKKNTCAMGLVELKKRTGLTMSTVRRAILSLEASGWIEVVKDYEEQRIAKEWRIYTPYELGKVKEKTFLLKNEIKTEKSNTQQCSNGTVLTGNSVQGEQPQCSGGTHT